MTVQTMQPGSTAVVSSTVHAPDHLPPTCDVDATTLLQVIARAAANPAVDIDKMMRLMEMQERIIERNAKAAYARDLAEMQPNLPTIDRKGKIVITDKTNAKNVIQSTPYALYEDIGEAVRPVLAAHGFALTHRTGQSSDGRITVTGILSHREGHSEETTITLQHDRTGSKNAVQAIGSSIQYGRRYTTLLILNITSRAPHDPLDDDGAKADGSMTVTDDQAGMIANAALKAGVKIDKLLSLYKAESISDIRAADFNSVMNEIAEVRKLREARNGGHAK